MKLGKDDVIISTSWRYCFSRFKDLGCLSLKETENLLNVWCKIKFFSLVIIENHILTRGYATRENIAFYDHS